jgi:hypothetical protein
VALGEMVRVLRPGGLLVAPTFLHREGLRAVLISTVLNLFGSFKRLDHEGLRRMVEEAGFHVEELDVVRGPMPLAFLVARSPVVRVAHVADEIARESAPTQPVPIEEEDAAGSLEAVDELPVEEEPAPGVPLPRELAPEAAGEPEAPPVEAAEVAPAAEEHAELAPAAEPPEPAAPAAEPTEEAPRPASRRPRRGPKAPSRVPVPAPTLRAVEFRYRASGEPKHVLLTGSFVGWSGKPEKTAAMVFDADAGAFVATIELPPGRHTYKYIVDGQWVPDPANPNAEPDGLGGVNSVREVE